MIFVAVVPQSQCHSVSRPKNGGETHVFFMQVLLTGTTGLGVEVEVGVGGGLAAKGAKSTKAPQPLKVSLCVFASLH